MKAIKAELTAKGRSADEIAAFEKGASAFAKKVVASFKDYEFFTGAGMAPEGMFVILSPSSINTHIYTDTLRAHRIALLNFREDGTTPYLTFWKHGLSEEKV